MEPPEVPSGAKNGEGGALRGRVVLVHPWGLAVVQAGRSVGGGPVAEEEKEEEEAAVAVAAVDRLLVSGGGLEVRPGVR